MAKEIRALRREDVDVELFWSKMDKHGPDECWNWQASKFHGGHGQFCVNGRPCRAHRVAYALEHGVCDASLLRHLCGSAACCNPTHLVPGTHMENMHDRREHGTWGRGALTDEQVEDIIELLQTGFAQDMIAEAYECSQAHVSQIATGRAWSWVRPDVDRSTLRRQKPHKPRTKITDEIRSRVRELRGQGLSQQAIGDRIGIDQKTVSRILKSRQTG